MIRFARASLALGVAMGLLVLVAGPAMAETSLTVAAPAEAVVGNTVPVTVTVTEDGIPVPDVVVVLSRSATFAGVTGYLTIVQAITDEAGQVDLSYVQRAADLTAELRVEVVDGDVAPLDFAVTSIGKAEQIYESEAGVDLPGLGGWILVALVAGVWLVILSTVLRLRSVSAWGRDESDEGDGMGRKLRLIPYALPGIVAVISVVLVTVLVRNPATHGNLGGPALGDRMTHSHLGESASVVSPGLDAAFSQPTGDAIEDGARRFFGLGCASCHGLDATSGAVGGDISGEVEDGLDEFLDEVRGGPKGMPAYPVDDFTDEDLALVHTYLESLFSE